MNPGIIVVLCAVMMTGCASIKHWFHRSPPVVLSAAERYELVSDSTALLTTAYQSGDTTLSVEGTQRDPLASDFETALRKAGFAVATTSDAPLKVAHIRAVSVVPDGILLRISVGDEWGADRLYHRANKMLMPETGFSVRKQGGQNNG